MKFVFVFYTKFAKFWHITLLFITGRRKVINFQNSVRFLAHPIHACTIHSWCNYTLASQVYRVLHRGNTSPSATHKSIRHWFPSTHLVSLSVEIVDRSAEKQQHTTNFHNSVEACSQNQHRLPQTYWKQSNHAESDTIAQFHVLIINLRKQFRDRSKFRELFCDKCWRFMNIFYSWNNLTVARPL